MQNKESYTDSENILNEVLKAEPGFILSDNFAEKLAGKVSRRFAWEMYFKEFLMYLGVLVGIGVILTAMAFIWYSANIEEWSNFLMSNISWVAGINLLVVFILFADKVVLRYLFYKNSVKSY